MTKEEKAAILIGALEIEIGQQIMKTLNDVEKEALAKQIVFMPEYEKYEIERALQDCYLEMEGTYIKDVNKIKEKINELAKEQLPTVTQYIQQLIVQIAVD